MVMNETAENEATQHLYRYARVVDRRDYSAWRDLFLPDGEYSATTYENERDSGLLMYIDRGHQALKERTAYLLGFWTRTHYKTLHTITNVMVDSDDGATLEVNSYFTMFRTDLDGQSHLHVCGEYQDTLRRTDDGLRFARHHVVLDAETLPSDMTDVL